MKKIIILSAVATLLLSAVSAFVYVNNDKDAMDDLFRANVEVLASDETIHPDGYVTCFHYVYDDGSPGYYLQVYRCFDCKITTATSVKNSDKCML